MRLGLILAAALFAAQPGMAHRLVIFAYAEDGEVVVETKFSSGRHPQTGEIKVEDAAGGELITLPLESDGETRFPIPQDHGGGIQINVKTGEGHADYWILTEPDLEQGRAE